MRLGDTERHLSLRRDQSDLSRTRWNCHPSVGRLTLADLILCGECLCWTHPGPVPGFLWRFSGPCTDVSFPTAPSHVPADLSFQNSTFTWFLLLSILQGLPLALKRKSKFFLSVSDDCPANFLHHPALTLANPAPGSHSSLFSCM